MAKTYTSNLTDFLDNDGQVVDSPASLGKMACFLTAIVEAVTPKCPTIGHNTGVRCRKRGCKGSNGGGFTGFLCQTTITGPRKTCFARSFAGRVSCRGDT